MSRFIVMCRSVLAGKCKRAVHRQQPAGGRRQLLQGSRQAGLVKLNRHQAMGENARLFDRVGQMFFDLARSRGQFLQASFLQVHLQCSDRATERSQVLAKAVMQIPSDTLPFVFTYLDDLLLESSRVLEQLDAGTGRLMPFFSGDAGERNEKEKGKSNRYLPRLNSGTRIQVPQRNVGPRPKHPGQSSDDKRTSIIAQPNGEHDRGCVKKHERHLVTSGEVKPGDSE